MKILYKPFAIIASLVGAKLGRTMFKSLWSKLDAAEPPAPTTGEASLPKVVGAGAPPRGTADMSFQPDMYVSMFGALVP